MSDRESSQELMILQSFSADLHRAAGINDAVRRILVVMTHQLGFSQAVIGLVDDLQEHVTDWIIQAKSDPPITDILPHPYKLTLAAKSGVLARAVLQNQIYQNPTPPLSSDDKFFRMFQLDPVIVVPMVWGVQPVGVLLLESPPLAETRLGTVAALAQQTAVAISMMNTRLRRAQTIALKEERTRIALDIHDNISQLLFGLQLTLEGSLKLLKTDPDTAQTELSSALEATRRVREQIHQTIYDNWDELISDQQFERDLQKYVVDVLQATHLQLVFDIQGDFASLSASAQRNLYRISQECLTNIVHHAAASNARVCVDIFDHTARLVIRDDGCGFNTVKALSQTHGQEHFGLRSMQERAQSLGGTCDIFSQPEAGTSIVVEFPI